MGQQPHRDGEVAELDYDKSGEPEFVGSDGGVLDTQEQQREELSKELRSNVAKAVAFVKGQETVASFAAFTFEEALDQQIERIEGAGTDTRPNTLDRIKKIKNGMVSVTEQLSTAQDDFFRDHDEDSDVNT